VSVSSDKLPGRRVLIALVALAAVGLVGGYGVAMRAKPHATRISLTSPGPDVRTSRRLIYVHVGGAVRRPGLYRLPDGSRIYDAIEAAGGGTKDADLDAVNLAAKVKDGDKVLVPTKAQQAGPNGTGAGPPGSGSGTQGGLVNINSATVEQLDSLPGIGPAIAQRIIDYRTEHGGFRSIDELMDVPGIGPAKFAELKDRITV
jgi:competence protein ComEA